MTGGLLKGTNITNNGTISFTGNSATVKGTAPITGLGSWSAEGDLTFETRVDNGHRDQTTNANAALNVRGTLTINDALNNAGKVTAANIEGRGSITNWNGYNNDEDLVIRCHTTFRHPFNFSWSGKTCDIRRSSKTTS